MTLEAVSETSESALARIERASGLITQAKKLDEAFALRALFKDAEIRARQKGLKDVEQKAIEYKFWIEDKIGELLQRMKQSGERVTPETARISNSQKGIRSKTLAELGVSAKESMRYQQFHNLPQEKKEEIIEKAKRRVDRAKDKIIDEVVQEAYRENPPSVIAPPDLTLEIVHGDFNQCDLPVASVDCIVTDPPYSQAYVGIWEDLGKVAARVLKRGAFLVAYSGQLNLPIAISSLSKYLDYVWLAGVAHTTTKPTINSCRGKVVVTNSWKPLLVFCKGIPERTIGFVDLLTGERGESKLNHDWAQGEQEARYIIEKFSQPGDVIFEPMAGGGTTIKSCIELKRSCIAYEIDEKQHAFLKRRFCV